MHDCVCVCVHVVCVGVHVVCVCVCVCVWSGRQGGGVYLDTDHGEVGPHHRVKIVEDVRLTQRILRLSKVTEL